MFCVFSRRPFGRLYDLRPWLIGEPSATMTPMPQRMKRKTYRLRKPANPTSLVRLERDKLRGAGKKTRKPKTSRQGSLLIDALLSIAIFGMIVAAFSSGITGGQQGTARGGNRTRAVYLAEEGLEAIRAIRDKTNGYATISARTLSQDDGIQLVGSTWTIVENPTVIDGIFTRKIVFSSGVDGNSRKVTSTVTWTELPGNLNLNVAVETYLSDWHTDPPPPAPNWAIPVLKGSVLSTAPEDLDGDLEFAVLEDIEVSGSYAFAANSSGGGKGLIIYDVTSLTSPLFKSAVTVSPAYDIAISGTHAFLATGDPSNELKILNISNPLSVSCSPCAAEVNLTGNDIVRGVSVSGSYLYVAREQSNQPELYVYDISNPIAPTLVSSTETDSDGARHMYAAEGGIGGATAYVYTATSFTTNELTVTNRATGEITGGGDAPNISNPQTGESVAVFRGGAFLGVGGDNQCELFAFNIALNPQDPNAAPACGSAQAYDVGGDTPEGGESVNDIETSLSLNEGFITTDTVRGGVNHFFHVLDFSDPTDITSAGKKIYDGNITAGYKVSNGLFYRESDHTAFLVGGAGGDLLILQPTTSY